MKALRERYVGAEAKRYEAKRAHTKQWRLEEKALREALTSLKPATVFDAPCGTGRFWPLYRELGIHAGGIDKSEDMLAQARARGWDDVALGDLLTWVEGGGSFDVTVCFRFLNWLDRDQCVRVLGMLGRTSRLAIIVSIGIGEGNSGRTILHDEGVFADAGLTIAARRKIRTGYYVITAEA